MVEVGSNWYIRGDIGYGEVNSPTIVPSAGLIPPVLYDIPGTGVGYDNSPVGKLPPTLPCFAATTRSPTKAFSTPVSASG